jgi:hypothetical protein
MKVRTPNGEHSHKEAQKFQKGFRFCVLMCLFVAIPSSIGDFGATLQSASKGLPNVMVMEYGFGEDFATLLALQVRVTVMNDGSNGVVLSSQRTEVLEQAPFFTQGRRESHTVRNHRECLIAVRTLVANPGNSFTQENDTPKTG